MTREEIEKAFPIGSKVVAIDKPDEVAEVTGYIGYYGEHNWILKLEWRKEVWFFGLMDAWPHEFRLI